MTESSAEPTTPEQTSAAWLRAQRKARGWTRDKMARQLIETAHTNGDTQVPGLDSMQHNIYRWERGADRLSERYRLLYCRTLGILPGDFGRTEPDGAAYLNGADKHGSKMAAIIIVWADGTTTTLSVSNSKLSALPRSPPLSLRLPRRRGAWAFPLLLTLYAVLSYPRR